MTSSEIGDLIRDASYDVFLGTDQQEDGALSTNRTRDNISAPPHDSLLVPPPRRPMTSRNDWSVRHFVLGARSFDRAAQSRTKSGVECSSFVLISDTSPADKSFPVQVAPLHPIRIPSDAFWFSSAPQRSGQTKRLKLGKSNCLCFPVKTEKSGVEKQIFCFGPGKARSLRR